MKRIILGLLTLLITSTGFVLVGPATAAEAANCRGKYQVREDPWNDKYTVDAFGGHPDVYDSYAGAWYRYFPNEGDDLGVRSLMITQFSHRTSDIDSRLRFDGMTWRSDAGEGDLGGAMVGKGVSKDDNGTSTLRGVAVVPLGDRRCWEVDDEPNDGPVTWGNQDEARFSNWPNTLWWFTNSDGIPQNTIHPDAASTIRHGSWQKTG